MDEIIPKKVEVHMGSFAYEPKPETLALQPKAGTQFHSCADQRWS